MLGMREEISEMIENITCIIIGPLIVFIVLAITSIAFIFYKNPCNKCILKVRCSEVCHQSKKWDSAHDIFNDAKEMPILAAAGACYILAVGIALYNLLV
jgi:hypothetical protein